ncbi:hypothetical protein T4A_3557 [Trichinella pseudospiralis]|uniref:EGF-like domain-containing protein n=1 Tax=Trichinella pseudospiralis TaxID=6337 RepID=A0A0V1AH83_TRIPS|nr:hypothetical protein T4A_8291 [Trichinella pseudospiralis]KRY24217.1 hypothetical protein T4A_9854 [Trichinella pseudospiralis]KRY24247.1 hypothetical protein T4A_3557 [Trichinella pseudospiralis]
MDDNNYICKCKTGFSGIHCEETVKNEIMLTLNFHI